MMARKRRGKDYWWESRHGRWAKSQIVGTRPYISNRKFNFFLIDHSDPKDLSEQLLDHDKRVMSVLEPAPSSSLPQNASPSAALASHGTATRSAFSMVLARWRCAWRFRLGALGVSVATSAGADMARFSCRGRVSSSM